MHSKKIALGLSGGVDSAVAAALLTEQGFDVTGVYLDIGTHGWDDAKKTADKLGIDFCVVDIQDLLEEEICRPFAEEYLRGGTPSPCVACNPKVKLRTLMETADRIGADKIATGHYARVCGGRLYKGALTNDQSYMLCKLTPDIVSRLELPLGGMDKVQVREKAAELGLDVADKPDSMEICFVPDGDYAAFIERYGFIPPEGEFVDETGRVLGRHRGIHHYTIGQRKRLGIALGRRMFVSEIDPQSNRVVLSSEWKKTSRIYLSDYTELAELENGSSLSVKVRHSQREYGARVKLTADGGATVDFDEPINTPSCGQYAAVYDGDLLLGGGKICAAEPMDARGQKDYDYR